MTKIQIFENIEETTIPSISFTRSKNGETGTASFFFKRPKAFLFSTTVSSSGIDQVSLVYQHQKLQTFDIEIHFFKGEPVLLECIFVFLNKNQWYFFCQFMIAYSKKKNLVLSSFI